MAIEYVVGEAASPEAVAGGLGRKVLLVTSSFPRWPSDSVTPFILQISQDLIALGWQVKVLAPHAPGALRDEVIEGVPVHRFRYLWPESQQVLCYGGGALANLRSNWLNRIRIIPLVICEWLAIVRQLRAERFDLVHSHWLLPQGLTAGMAARVCGIPHVATVHGSDVFALPGFLLTLCKRMAIRLSDCLTVNSSATEEAVRAIGHAKKILRIPIGAAEIDASASTDSRQVRERFRVGRGPLVLFVGRLVEQKGCEDLVRAIALASDALPDLRVVIVGDGPQRLPLESLAADLDYSRRVSFVGWVPAAQVATYLAAADMLVMPSRRDRDGAVEGQGLVLIEAMLAGTPVIATGLGGVTDIVRHEHTGLIIAERSPQQISEAITRLAGSPALVRAMCTQARELATTHFTRRVAARAFSECFEKLLLV